MKRLLYYYSFIIVAIMALISFTSAESIGQLIPAIFFFPLAVYFGILITPKRSKAILLPKYQSQSKKLTKKEVKVTEGKVTKLKGFDMDRRAFLKLIGSAGLTVFFFSIFAKRAEAAFFGSVPGPGIVGIKDSTGTLIDPAIKHPTDGYKINQLDDSNATYSYYGFTNKDGAWFIMRETTSGVDAGQYRYRKGASGFPAGWSAKADNPETYDYFDEIFD